MGDFEVPGQIFHGNLEHLFSKTKIFFLERLVPTHKSKDHLYLHYMCISLTVEFFSCTRQFLAFFLSVALKSVG